MDPRHPLLHLLGLRPTGDFAELTVYTNRRGKPVWFPKSPPKVPETLRQRGNRLRWAMAAKAWRNLTDEQRENWQAASRLAKLYLPGYQLWIFWQTTRDRGAIATVERLSGRTLIPS